MPATGVDLLAALVRTLGPLSGRQPDRPAFRFLLPGLWLVGALLVGALVIAVVGRWRRVPRSGVASASQQLTEFRSLYEKGDMSRDEYERIRSLLGGEIRGPGPPAAAPPAAALQPPAAPPAAPPPAAARSADETPPDGIVPA
jgi:hypothetical protein